MQDPRFSESPSYESSSNNICSDSDGDPVDSSLPIFPNLKRNAIATGSVDGTGSATARHKAQHTTSVSSKAKKRKPKPTKLTHKKKRRIPDLGENEADEIATAVLGAVSGTKEETTSSCLEDINQVDPEVFCYVLESEGDDQAEVYPPTTWLKVELYDGMRRPVAIENLPPVENLAIADNPLEEFSHHFLTSILGGEQHLNGWYLRKKEKKRQGSYLFPHVTSYLMLKGDHQPLLPRFPGDHGAQITATIEANREREGKMNCLKYMPLFIKRSNEDYKYYGTYREPCYPDRLGANEMRRELPLHIKKFWANKMGGRKKSRWSIEAIREAWPGSVVGWLADDNKTIVKYDQDLEESLGEPLSRPISAEEADGITVRSILEAFEAPDMGGKPALRLFYEYLQCDGYDKAFYEALVTKKHDL